MLKKKILFDKINGTKNVIFFFRELQPITVLILICGSYMNGSTKFLSLKLYVGFSIFDTVPFLLKFIFLLMFLLKWVDSSPLKRHNSFQN